MNSLELLEVDNDHDHGQPGVNAEYVPGPWTGAQRTDLTPLHITQPAVSQQIRQLGSRLARAVRT